MNGIQDDNVPEEIQNSQISTLEKYKFGVTWNGLPFVRTLSALLTGNPFLISVSTTTTPGSTQTLVNETVGAGKTLKINKVRVTCRQRTTYKIYEDSNIIGSGRLGAGKYNDEFTFGILKTISAGSVLKIETLSGGPATDIEVYLHALES